MECFPSVSDDDGDEPLIQACTQSQSLYCQMLLGQKVNIMRTWTCSSLKLYLQIVELFKKFHVLKISLPPLSHALSVMPS